MPFPRFARAGRCAGAGVVAATAPLLLAGCSDAAGLGAAAVLGALLLAGVAALAFAWGRRVAWQQQARQDQNTLAQERQARRASEALLQGHLWRTDAQHRLLSWAAPGQPAQGHSALFESAPAQTALLPNLRAERPFAELHVQGHTLFDGSRGWVFSAVPQHDGSGRFGGFAGVATPTDAASEQRLALALVAPLLAAQPAAAAVLLDSGSGWQLHQCNAAAQALWPQAGPGSTLADVLARWPDTVNTLLVAPADADAAAQQRSGPWLIQRLALPTQRVIVLTHEAPGGSTAPATPAAPEGDSFSFTLSHDLRAPIRVVEGFTKIVKEDYGRQLDRVGNDHLDRVLGAAARMNLMIDALLTLARLSQQPLARQRVNLSQLAGYVVDDLKRGAPEREAEIVIEPQLSAWGDPTLLRLVLENLLGNAWKYTAKVSPAQIVLREVPHHNGSTASRALMVRDNGAGFDMRSADRLFGLFQRLHSASDFPGHGVGLASVQRIVRRHGGEIWAESEPGKGAAFYFTLAG
jgi:signal transduction histidine kinase